jgi:HEAT repeat protein
MADFKEKLQKLGNGDAPTAASLKFLSDLSSEDRAILREVWPTLPSKRRKRIVDMMAEIIEDNIDLNFRHVFLNALEDRDPDVRRSAIEGLTEDTSTLLLGRLLTMVRQDPDEDVREASAIALSRYTYLHQCDKLGTTGQAQADRLRETLMQSAGDHKEDDDVRRRAVESLGYYHQDEDIQQLIADQYRQGGQKAESAVLAMGRSIDHQWHPIILHELNSQRPAMRYEAAHAAGEMVLEEALPNLIRLLNDQDLEVKLSAVWALGQIGSKPASDAIKRVLETDDPAMREAAQEAMQEITFAANPLSIVQPDPAAGA